MFTDLDFRLLWPWLLLLWPLPWLAAVWRPRGASRTGKTPHGEALFLPFELPNAMLAVSVQRRVSERLGRLVFWLLWTLLVLALARPQWAGAVREEGQKTVRSQMVVLDISSSMGNQDLRGPGDRRLTRLEAAQGLLRGWFARHPADRAGLVVFGRNAFVHLPMTADRAALAGALDELQPGLAGQETALGDALSLALKHLSSAGASGSSAAPRAIWLLTDGQQNAGTLSVNQAAWLAQRAGVPVHALGIGAQVDEIGLAALSEQTGGLYALATDMAGVQAFSTRLAAAQTVANQLPPPERPWRDFGMRLALLVLGLTIIAWAVRSRAARQTSLTVERDSPWRAVIDPALHFQLQADGDGSPTGAQRARFGWPLRLAMAAAVAVLWSALWPVFWPASGALPAQSLTVVVVELSPELPVVVRKTLPERVRAALSSAPAGEVALVAYGDEAYVIAPPTADRAAAAFWLDELSPDVLPRPGNRPDRAVARVQQLLDAHIGAKQVLWLGASLPPAPAPRPIWGGVTSVFSRLGPPSATADALAAWLGGHASSGVPKPALSPAPPLPAVHEEAHRVSWGERWPALRWGLGSLMLGLIFYGALWVFRQNARARSSRFHS